MTSVRTRFAPSPTGDLHLGGVRTALFNWLLARRLGGAFLLRLDDTDRERSTAAAEASILGGLTWLGLGWDGDVVRQSARADLHRAHALRLLDEGLAYRCTCTPAELEARRIAGDAGYDRRCRAKAPARAAFAVRFAMPLDGETVVDDGCRGRVAFANATLDDQVILKADGSPTYNFATVVDDALMGITHIVRGDDLLNATPRQIQLYRALGFTPPAFAHLPLVLGRNRQRLSKRHGAEAVLTYRDRGFLPEAVLNAAARLGWSGGGGATQREVFTLDEVIGDFALGALTRSPAVFDPDKLVWLNHAHMGRLADDALAARVAAYAGFDLPLPRLARLCAMNRRSSKTLADMAAFVRPLVGPIAVDPALVAQHVAPVAALAGALAGRWAALQTWDTASLDAAGRGLVADQGAKLGPLAQALRVALTGATVSAGVFEVAAALGRDEALARIARALG